MASEREIVEARWAVAARDPRYFSRWFVFTLDSQAQERGESNPIRPWPARPHLDLLCGLWWHHPMLFVAKSRQMMVTWFASMISVWQILFRRGALVYQQSKRLEDAMGDEATGDGLLGRSKFILSHVPYRSWLLPRRVVVRSDSIQIPGMHSGIQAIAQGGDKIRSHTVTQLVSDETAFQPEFSAALTATMSSIRKGRFLGITTPDLTDGGASMRLALDMTDEEAIA